LTTNRSLIWKILNGDISATSYPIHVIFGSMMDGLTDRMALFPVKSNPRWWPWPLAMRLISEGKGE